MKTKFQQKRKKIFIFFYIKLLKSVKNLTIFEFIIQLNYIIYINKTNNKQLKN